MLRIILIDDHTLFRELLIPTLESLDSNTIIFQATTINEGNRLVDFHKEINLIFLDLSYPDRQNWKEFSFNHVEQATPVIILTSSSKLHDIQTAINFGCKGYITKSSNKQNLLNGIKTILQGKTYYSPDILSLIDKSKNSNSANDSVEPKTHNELSTRQNQILKYLSKGYSNKKIATQCRISEGTVKLHVSTILKVLGVSNRTEAALKVSSKNFI